jgi:hypothetical protein
MIKKIKKIISPIRKLVYKNSNKKPWSYGYLDVRWEQTQKNICNENLLHEFSENRIPKQFGVAMDERIVEYPWIFSRLSKNKGFKILDAGSTFNFPEIISHNSLKEKELSIYTFYPESINFINHRVTYAFGDLRDIPFKENFFDEVVCQSTIEHIDMDNSIYGYELEKNKDVTAKSFEYLKVIDELIRVVKKGGKLLITFPYGKFENQGFFQQFDTEMVTLIINKMKDNGTYIENYIKYTKNGWENSTADQCRDAVSFNPHKGVGQGDDNAAHSRAICCLEFTKNK